MQILLLNKTLKLRPFQQKHNNQDLVLNKISVLLWLGEVKKKGWGHTVKEELLKSFDQISSTSHFPNQRLVHKQGGETGQNAAN